VTEPGLLVAAADAERLATYLAAFDYRWTSELELQDAIWDLLLPRFPAEFPLLQREAILSPQDRPDFMVTVGGTTVAVEVKVKGSRNAVLRQLGRYAAHDEVDAVLLASGRRVLAATMPPSIHGKPLLAVFVGASL
jgi:hypothetical protein